MSSTFTQKLSVLLLIISFAFSIDLAGQGVIISEILASNHSSNYDKDFYEFSDWIELYNPTNSPIDIGGYRLSNDRNNKGLWKIKDNTVIPAKSFLIIWADGMNTVMSEYHASFKLDKDKGGVYLTDLSWTIVDSLVYGNQRVDISYGIAGEDKTQKLFFENPTPGRLNPVTGYVSASRSAEPEFSVKGGVYNHAVTLYLNSPVGGASIRYTTDGSNPTRYSREYTSPLSLDATTVIRAIAVEDGKTVSKTVTNTYIINENITLPVVSLTMDEEFFWDDSIGFYVEGVNGLTGAETGYGPSPKSNFNRDWRRPMHIEFYDEELKPAFSTDGEVKVYGGWSRGAVVKSLAIYPDSPVDYRLFKEKPFEKYESFILRNAGNEWAKTKLRDAILQSIAINQVDVDLQANRPAVLFINGEFWGVYNIREKINEDYVKVNHGYDQDNLDFLEAYRIVKSGDMVHYNNMMDFLNNHDLADPENYEYIKTQMDVYECMNYFMTGIYSGHGDWIYNGNNNLRLWRPRTPDGVWRWLLYDTDGSFYSSTARGIEDCVNRSVHLAKLLDNDEAREYFINTFSALLNNAFAPERAVYYIDSLKALITADMPRHVEKWLNTDENGDPAEWKTPGADGYIQQDDGYGGPCLSSYAQWESYVSTMYSIAKTRPGVLLNELQSYFNLGEQTDVSFMVSAKDAGIIELNNILVQNYNTSQKYFAGQTLHLSAQPRFGYKFKSWKKVTASTTVLISNNNVWSYSDEGTDLGTSWRDPGYDDSTWKTGNGELGYGDGNEATVVSYGPDSNNKYITTYFRKVIEVDSANMKMPGEINLRIDDGAVVYINGTEVVRYNLPSGTVGYSTLASSAIGGDDEVTYKTFNLPEGILQYGDNVIAVEVHQVSASSSDISFDLALSARRVSGDEDIISTDPEFDYVVGGDAVLMAEFEAEETTIDLHINEFVANNRASYYDEEGKSADWIEIYNSGTDTIDLAGMYMTDDLTNPMKCKIQGNGSDSTKVAPGGHILLFADGNPEEGVRHLNFRLDGDGEQIGLSDLIANEIVYYDTITFGPQIMDLSYGRYPDGNGDWQILEKATPALANELYARDPVYGLYINEIMAYDGNEPDGTYPDWIEIYNDNDFPVDLGGLFLTDNPDNLTKCRVPSIYPDSTTIPAKGFIVLTANEKASESILNLNFKLNSMGEELGLIQYSSGSTRFIDYFRFGQQSNDASYGRLPDGSNTIQVLPSKTPGSSNSGTTSIEEHNDYRVVLYPNPASGTFYLDIESTGTDLTGELIVKVFNSNGRVMGIRKVYNASGSITESFDISDYANGLYFVQIISDSGSVTLKLNKK